MPRAGPEAAINDEEAGGPDVTDKTRSAWAMARATLAGLLLFAGRAIPSTEAAGPPPDGAPAPDAPAGKPARSIVGAIRWDAWHGDGGLDGAHEVFDTKEGKLTPGLAVERILGPKHWHYRLPFYAKVVGEN
jgi:hypothetical protein